MRSAWLSMAFIALLAASLVADDGIPDRPISADEVAGWIEGLDSPSFDVRERATRRLKAAGPARTRDALRVAAELSTSEAARRARRLLDQFERGAYVDTPWDIAEMVERFHRVNEKEKQAAFERIVRRGHLAVAASVLRSMPRGSLQRDLATWANHVVSKDVGRLYEEGRHVDLREWYGAVAEIDDDERSNEIRSGHLLVRNEVESEVTRLERRLAAGADDQVRRSLFWLLLAADRIDEAEVLGLDDPSARREIAFRRFDWTALAVGENDSGTAEGERLVDRVIFRALARLPTRPADVRRLLRLSRVQGEHPFHDENRMGAAAALTTAGRHRAAATIYQRADGDPTGFEIACLRDDHAFAASLLRIDSITPEALLEWYERESRRTSWREASWLVRRAMVMLRELVRLHDRAAARPFLDRMRQTAQRCEPRLVRQLAGVARELGYDEVAFEDAGPSLLTASIGDDSIREAFIELFPGRHFAAFAAWSWRRRHVETTGGEETPAESLAWVDDFVSGRPCGVEPHTIVEEFVAKDTEGLVEQLSLLFDRVDELEKGEPERIVASKEPEDVMVVALFKGAMTQLSAEMAFECGELNLARSTLAGIPDVARTSDVERRTGDLAAAKGDWSAAAEHYERVVSELMAEGYLHATEDVLLGRALVRAGDADRGRMLVERGRATHHYRYSLAEELEELGDDDAAVEVLELALRTARQGDDRYQDVVPRRLAQHLERSDPLRAARLYELSLTQLQGPIRQLEILYLSHVCRAEGLLRAGRVDECLEEAERAHAAIPGRIELASRIVPFLVARGREAAAESVLARTRSVLQDRIERFPNGPAGHHDLARLELACGRDLDAALRHARRAVALDDRSVEHHLTLAKVRIVREEFDEATVSVAAVLGRDPRHVAARRMQRLLLEE